MEMAEERAKHLTDIAKIIEEKAKNIDRCNMEGVYETDIPWEELVLELEKARKCVDSLLAMTGGQKPDMTKPQPYLLTTQLVTEENGKLHLVKRCLDDVDERRRKCITALLDSFGGGSIKEHLAAKRRLAEELTNVITAATTGLNALGYNEEERGELQRLVNENNQKCGRLCRPVKFYFEEYKR